MYCSVDYFTISLSLFFLISHNLTSLFTLSVLFNFGLPSPLSLFFVGGGGCYNLSETLHNTQDRIGHYNDVEKLSGA